MVKFYCSFSVNQGIILGIDYIDLFLILYI